MKFSFISVIILLIFQSCFKDDERVIPFAGETTTINDSVQTHESFFDFESGKIVAVSSVNNWQLGFECGNKGWRIITNSGGGWFIHNTGQKSIPSGSHLSLPLNGLYDDPHLWPDSTAIGKWVNFNGNLTTYTRDVYVLGKLVNGNFTSVKELVFLSLTDSSYTFYYHDEISSDTVRIVKNNNFNFTYYYFGLGQVQPEPEKTSYDIVFTSYYDLATLFGQTIPYHVGGALLNVWQTEAALDSSSTYESITIETVPLLDFSAHRDIPGYQWKSVTVDITGGGTATYRVKTNFNYIFKTQEGNYFKLRFLSYTLDGNSGFPRFEHSRIE